jgi:predicted nucleic acid-binding protein
MKHAQQQTTPYAAPLVILDANYLIDQLRYAAKSSLPSAKILDSLHNLCEAGKTIIIPEQVLLEVHPELVNKVREQKGFSAHQKTHSLKADIAAQLHKLDLFFDTYANADKLRYYHCLNDMLADGETQNPKGGIVVVNIPVKQKHCASTKDPFNGTSQGDNAIMRLSQRIITENLIGKTRGITFPVFTRDKGLIRRLTELNTQQANIGRIICCSTEEARIGDQLGNQTMLNPDKTSLLNDLTNNTAEQLAAWNILSDKHHNIAIPPNPPPPQKWIKRIEHELHSSNANHTR